MHDLSEAYLLIAVMACASALVGGLLFAGGSVAPVAVRVLPEAGAARFLRAFWPRYYRFGTIGGVGLTVFFALIAPVSPMGLQFTTVLAAEAALLAICMWLALRMIPAVNAARDEGRGLRFARLHGGVMAITAIGVLAGLALLATLGWALPARYLIWMQ